MQSTLSRVLFAILLLCLLGLAGWIWYDSSPAPEVPATEKIAEDEPVQLETEQTENDAPATDAASIAELQALRESIDSLRQQIYRNEANLRYELTATYQRLARLEQDQQNLKSLMQGDTSALRKATRQIVELIRLYASYGFADSEQLLNATADWLGDRPEYAELAAQLGADATRVREWNSKYHALIAELDGIEYAFNALPARPAMPEQNAPVPTENRDLLQTVKNFIADSFRVQRSAAVPEPLSALAREVYLARATLLVGELRFMARQRSPGDMPAMKTQLLSTAKKFPDSRQRTELQQRIEALKIPPPFSMATTKEQ